MRIQRVVRGVASMVAGPRNRVGTVVKDVDQSIRERRTLKVLAPEDLPITDIREVVTELIGLGGQAPFHRACEDQHRQGTGLPGIEPWRFYALDAASCRRLKTQLSGAEVGKIPAMLAAADALVLATWLPNQGMAEPGDQEPGYAATLSNMEHIAAAGAAIQNLLIAATARGLSTYWSSGGVLRQAPVFELLRIPRAEILLGALFIFPAEHPGAEAVTSKLREKRGPSAHWSRWIDLT